MSIWSGACFGISHSDVLHRCASAERDAADGVLHLECRPLRIKPAGVCTGKFTVARQPSMSSPMTKRLARNGGNYGGDLDARLRGLLQNIEFSWLGAFKVCLTSNMY